MKKVLGISLVAVLAVSPLMAHAAGERTVTAINASAPTAGNSDLASTSYVQGAYASVADKVDALILDTAAIEGKYVKSGKTVYANLDALDGAVEANTDAIAVLNGTGENSVAGKISAAIQNVNGNAGDLGELDTTEKGSLVAAVNEVNSAASTNAGNITTNTNNIAEINNREISYVNVWPNGATQKMKISELDKAE